MNSAQGPLVSNVGMVVAGHPLAAEAGRAALISGGSATDALIASAAVLCVVLPQAVTIGGDAFGLFYEAANRSTHGLNASGRAPSAVMADQLKQADIAHGAISPTVPALVGGWEAAHRRFGTLPWADLFGPAIAAAENGVPVSRILASAISQHVDLITRDAGLAALLIPNGSPLAAGALLRQPQLAESLRAIAGGGANAFYQGPVARSLVARVSRDGGLLRYEDFARPASEWVRPISVDYRGHTVATVPPNSFGLLGLLQLKQLAKLGTRARSLGERLSEQIEAAEQAFACGAYYLADPDFTRLTSDDIQALVANFERPLSETGIGSTPGGTAVTMAADRDGNAAVLVQSIFTLFGSGVYDGDSGILLNNRMRGFSLDAGHPNVVAAGKRPAHTLSPMLGLSAGRLNLVLATPGGLGQTPTLVQVLEGCLHHGLDLEAAIARSRWTYDLDRRVLLEDGIPDDVLADLVDRNISAYRPRQATPFFGSVKAIQVSLDGTLCGVADRRRDGAVAAL